MNIVCSKQKLQEGISIVTKAITGKTTMPVLEGIYIEANKNGLTLIGSDMDVSIETKVEAEVISHDRGPKIKIQHYRSKTGYKRRLGHRQELTTVKVTDIKVGK